MRCLAFLARERFDSSDPVSDPEDEEDDSDEDEADEDIFRERGREALRAAAALA